MTTISSKQGLGEWTRSGRGGWGRANRPVMNVNWADAQTYIRWLNARLGPNRGKCRLQPGYETLALMPSTHHKPQPAGHLEGHAQEKNALDRPVPLHRSCGFHERNVCGYA